MAYLARRFSAKTFTLIPPFTSHCLICRPIVALIQVLFPCLDVDIRIG